MDSDKKYPSVDPVDLIHEHYEAVKIPDEYRRELQTKSRNIIAKRRRRRASMWAFGLAGVAVLSVILVLAGRLMYMGPHGGRTAPMHKQLQIASGTTSHAKTTGRKSNPLASAGHVNRRTISTITNSSKITLRSSNPEKRVEHAVVHVRKGDLIRTSMKKDDPIAVISSTFGRVTNGECKVLVPGDRISIGKAISTGRDGRAILVTRGGSELIMDSCTHFVFTSRDTVKIARGRLYCANRNKEIARLNTLAGSVKLLGTTVDVNLLRRGKIAVTVVDGKVELSNKHGTSLINAGNQSIMATYSVPWRGLSAGTINETAWYQGKGDYQSDFGDIAYTVSRADGLTTEVWTVKEDGSDKHRVCSFIGMINDLGPWLPGQRWLTMNYYSPLWTTPDIKNRTASGGAGHPIIDGPSWLLDIATGQIQALDRLPEGYRGFYFSMAPDPRLVAFTGWHKGSQEENEPGLFLYDRSSGDVTHLLDGNIKTAAAWAPDCKHIAISSGQDYTNYHDLQIIDVETGEAHSLGINGAGACFSPDGTKLAYCGDFKKNGSWYAGVPMSSSIFVLDLSSGSAPVRVSPKEEWATRPRWSPDSSRILYITGNRICIVNADGSGSKDVYCSDGDIFRASWSQVGDTLFITERANDRLCTLAVAADGSGVKKVYSGAVEDNQLAPEVQKQTNQAAVAIKEAIFQYAMGKVHSFEGDLAARRESYTKSRDIFSKLVWDYPLSGLCIDDAIKYADAAGKELQLEDKNILQDSCQWRLNCLNWVLSIAAAKHHRFPPDLATALEWVSSSTWQYGWLRSNDKQHVMMLGVCPGSQDHPSVPYIYNAPADGSMPNVGDIILECPVHSDKVGIWDESNVRTVDKKLIVNGEPGAWCRVENGLPYYFENVGSDGLTIIHHLIGDTYEVIGEARLLPTGKIYNNESLKIAKDEGAIGREIATLGATDWGNLPQEQVSRAQADLRFCQAVAAFESGQQVDDPDSNGNLYKTIDGEPARLTFSGQAGGSCGAFGSDLRFELIGPEDIELYQLKPSGRFRVYGTVKVVQTGRTCKNGWIDKDGKVTLTEE